jgi:DNA-binding MarR family transcriptional regulator
MEILYSELFEAAGIGRRVGEAIASNEGRTQGQWQTLWTIENNSLTVPQIARRLGVTRQNTQRVASELVDAGLAEFTANPDHKTSPLLQLTPAGREALNRLNTTAEHTHSAIMQTFNEQDITNLRALLHKFVDANHKVENNSSPPIPRHAT